MRSVVQRVSRAAVSVEGRVVGQIGQGLMVLLGAGQGDGEDEARFLADRVVGLRIFEDDQGKMNLSVGDVGGALLVISQFTLYGDLRRGRRPSFTGALEPIRASELVELFIAEARARGLKVESGVFGAHMQVELINDGPVTLILDTEDWQRSRRGLRKEE